MTSLQRNFIELCLHIFFLNIMTNELRSEASHIGISRIFSCSFLHLHLRTTSDAELHGLSTRHLHFKALHHHPRPINGSNEDARNKLMSLHIKLMAFGKLRHRASDLTYPEIIQRAPRKIARWKINQRSSHHPCESRWIYLSRVERGNLPKMIINRH